MICGWMLMVVSAVKFLSMEYTINNDFVAHNFKKCPVIARPHSLFEVIAEALHIAAKVVFQPS